MLTLLICLYILGLVPTYAMMDGPEHDPLKPPLIAMWPLTVIALGIAVLVYFLGLQLRLTIFSWFRPAYQRGVLPEWFVNLLNAILRRLPN